MHKNGILKSKICSQNHVWLSFREILKSKSFLVRRRLIFEICILRSFFFFCHLIETKMTRRVSFKGIFETNLLSWTKNWYSLFVMSASLITRSFFLFYPALNIWRAHYIPYCTKIQKKDIYIGLEHRNKT